MQHSTQHCGITERKLLCLSLAGTREQTVKRGGQMTGDAGGRSKDGKEVRILMDSDVQTWKAEQLR